MALSAIRNSSLALVLVGALNWGVVAIRNTLGDTADSPDQIPDLLAYALPPELQTGVYYAVFVSSLVFLGTYVYEIVASRIEVVTEEV